MEHGARQPPSISVRGIGSMRALALHGGVDKPRVRGVTDGTRERSARMLACAHLEGGCRAPCSSSA
jgi:hypothetical protein